MKTKIALLALVAGLSMASAVAAREDVMTWVTPGAAVEATEAAGKDSPYFSFFYEQTLAYVGAAQLGEAFVDKGGTLPAGTFLFEVQSEEGRRYFCNNKALRTVGMGDALGLGLRNSLLGQVSGASSMPRELAWQCFRDTDGDNAFDEVGGGQPVAMSAIEMVSRIDNVTKLAKPLPYAAADTAAGPKLKVGLVVNARRVAKNKPPLYDLMLCVQRAAEKPALTCYEQPAWKYTGEPVPIASLGGLVTIESITGKRGEEVVTYKVEQPLNGRFSTHARFDASGGAYNAAFRQFLVTPLEPK